MATIDEYVASSANLTTEARKLTDEPGRLLSASDPDLDQMNARLGASRVKLRAIRESLENHLTEARTMNQMYREKKL